MNKKNSLDVGTMLYFMIMNDLFILLLQRLLDEYKFPVYTTESCPKSNTEWLERSSSLQCNKTNGYMCIPNEEITMLLEFCYRVPKTLIPKGKEGWQSTSSHYDLMQKFHSEFIIKVYNFVYTAGACLILYESSSAVDDYKCRHFSFGCPKFPYFSNEIYKRKHCFYRNLLLHWFKKYITSFNYEKFLEIILINTQTCTEAF